MSGAGSLLSLRKEADPEGTWEEKAVAFQLFAGVRPRMFGTYAYLSTPHVGVYNHDDYTPALPIALVSLPLPAATEATRLPGKLAAVLARARLLGLVAGDVQLYLQIHSGACVGWGGGRGGVAGDVQLYLQIHSGACVGVGGGGEG
jgi:hypothetical protein